MEKTNDDTILMAESSDSELDDEAIIETSTGPRTVTIQEPDDVDPKETNDIEAVDEFGSEEENGGPTDEMTLGSSMKQKKLRHKKEFASWLVRTVCTFNYNELICDSRIAEKLEEPAEMPSRVVTDEDQMSAKDLISSKKRIIHDPRVYQMELFEIAKQKNTIAVLDTGL